MDDTAIGAVKAMGFGESLHCAETGKPVLPACRIAFLAPRAGLEGLVVESLVDTGDSFCTKKAADQKAAVFGAMGARKSNVVFQ